MAIAQREIVSFRTDDSATPAPRRGAKACLVRCANSHDNGRSSSQSTDIRSAKLVPKSLSCIRQLSAVGSRQQDVIISGADRILTAGEERDAVAGKSNLPICREKPVAVSPIMQAAESLLRMCGPLRYIGESAKSKPR
jgi:hypothetical protein